MKVWSSVLQVNVRFKVSSLFFTSNFKLNSHCCFYILFINVKLLSPFKRFYSNKLFYIISLYHSVTYFTTPPTHFKLIYSYLLLSIKTIFILIYKLLFSICEIRYYNLMQIYHRNRNRNRITSLSEARIEVSFTCSTWFSFKTTFTLELQTRCC